MKIITMCGSLKFKEHILQLAIQEELKGNVALVPIFPIDGKHQTFDEDELRMLAKMHKEKIRLSDAILVVDVDYYIGDATKSEIAFAKSIDKEIIYYTDLKNVKQGDENL